MSQAHSTYLFDDLEVEFAVRPWLWDTVEHKSIIPACYHKETEVSHLIRTWIGMSLDIGSRYFTHSCSIPIECPKA